MEKEKSRLMSKNKILLSLLAALVLPVTIFICGTADIYLSNSDEFQFILADFWPHSIGIGVMFFLLIATVLFLLRGRAYPIALSLIIGLSLMSYLQANFLSFGYGGLLSDTEEGISAVFLLINLFIWLAVLGGCICAALFIKDHQMTAMLAVIVLVMVLSVQAINLTVSLITSDESEKSSYILTDDNLFEVSQKDNIIVFVLDRFDIYYYDQLIAEDSDFFAPLDGFTLYDNNISLYSRTYPAITYMLTGVENDFDRSRVSYFEKAYSNAEFFDDLVANDYKINLYTADFYAYDSARVFGDTVANASRYSLYSINDRAKLVTKMICLSLYRYLPLCVRPILPVSTADFSEVISYDFEGEESAERERYTLNDAETYRKFRESGLNTQSENNTFSFLHLNGCHNPYNIDENGSEIEPNNYASATIPALRGCFKMIFEYIEQMKSLGIYENATIIITGDHARAMSDRTDVEDARVTTLFVKPSGEEGSPLAISHAPVCQENLRAEIVKAANLKTENDYGLAFSDIAENADITRKYYFQKSCDDGDEIVVYHVVEDAKDFSNWTLTDRIEIGSIYR